jgi:hypothetical protein
MNNNYPDPNEMTYVMWKARIRRDIKRALRRSPGLHRHSPEHIAKILGMNEYEIFYARALTKFVKVVEMIDDLPPVERPWSMENRWAQLRVNPWRNLYKRQEEEGWWTGQMVLPL